MCANGVISIGDSLFTTYVPQLFPLSGSNVIAPFWNDHDPRGGDSKVYYKVYTRDQSTSSNEKINMVGQLVTSKKNLDNNFIGSWMLVAYWNNVPPYPYVSICNCLYNIIIFSNDVILQ